MPMFHPNLFGSGDLEPVRRKLLKSWTKKSNFEIKGCVEILCSIWKLKANFLSENLMLKFIVKDWKLELAVISIWAWTWFWLCLAIFLACSKKAWWILLSQQHWILVRKHYSGEFPDQPARRKIWYRTSTVQPRLRLRPGTELGNFWLD